MNTEKPGYAHGLLSHRRVGERERLRLLAEVCDPTTQHIIEHLTLPKRARCLELGAGDGSIAAWLTQHRPGGHIVATDIDTGFLTTRTWPSPVTVYQHDLVREGFPRAAYDLVHARALLTHLPQPEQITARLCTWLTPGGWLVIEDPTYLPLGASPHPEFASLLHGCERLLARTQGTDHTWANRIAATMIDCGLTEVRMTVRTAVCGNGDPEDDFWRSCFNQAAPALIDQGLLTESEVDGGLHLMQRPGFRDIAWLFISCWGRRSTTAH
ncbi:class I SAM-dependent methyltransferase [Streptomyces sp. NBC_01092]|uniref:class I SAM-dependent methyltransferase n=1 Tax=Streptomyces sp. NBC_01092 TaxID=2903748 RepID=UPI003866C449|nr:methyltransferase domain-containing protein [Streptomyces sp. NBC_01092]WSU55751.1 methyltransferase domain-containing protein [Streptomyces sp. NBC_01092]